MYQIVNILMKQITKKTIVLSVLLFLNLLLFNKINFEIWVLVRAPLLTGLIISLAITFPEFNFHWIKKMFSKKKQ